ncbi:hypothetical protein QUF75_12030 [Desulfococcaceae bacterium HSG7]|nr:hypothetical protein [Desulfococcaceae bacterium HSG7]
MNQQKTTSSSSHRLRQLLHYWFVQYNPLYFFSALCVLLGMFLITRELPQLNWQHGHIFASAVMQVYELMLISGAALLFRGASQYRPSVILGLLAVFFMFDCTLQTEGLAAVSPLYAVMWICMIPVKITALVYAFRLRASWDFWVFPALAGSAIAVAPHLMRPSASANLTILIIASWLGFLLAAVVIEKRPLISCTAKLDTWGLSVLRKSVNAVWMIWFGFYFYHLIVWNQLFGVLPGLVRFAPLAVVIPLFNKIESHTWIGGIVAITVSFWYPPAVAPTALGVGLFLSLMTYSRSQQRRLIVGAVCAFYIACQTFGWQHWPLPPLNMAVNLVTVAVLLLIAWRLKMRCALLPLLFGLVPAIIKYLPLIIRLLTSLSGFEWGIILLLTGFVALVAGIAVNWNMRGEINEQPTSNNQFPNSEKGIDK